MDSVVHFYVSDADAVHPEWAAADVEGRSGEPHGTDCGLREFGYVDPDGTLHGWAHKSPLGRTV
ncbi:MAG: hypothetical protein JOZ81_31015 [Chloroflexi bacterium]|nr:hypothetical protein [Chloroflexota bacterium]